MTDPTARPQDHKDQAAPEPADAAAAPGAEAVRDPLAEAQREAAEMKDKLLRTLAEMENLRRRTEREVSDARLYGISGFARDVLGVADNMQRAMQALEDELRGNESVKVLVEGVELTERELLKVLEKHGVKRFSPLGEKFDPNMHQAMYEVPDASAAPGTVAQVIQDGYKIGERVLRPAMVAVFKAPPKAAAASANDD
ncbi:MAG: nucleotide exchange factor GrpE [Xanthobacteraceae bacterium]|uniref:nucleotide exchange factor GrpE n=1 Tax=Pseudolabrys sp. TaxID=1960880 RepID=UPI003D1399AE